MKQTCILITDEEGYIPASQLEKLLTLIKEHRGCKVRVEVDKYKARRSDQQNKYIHWMFTEFTKGLNAMGSEIKADKVKEMLKFKFALVDVIDKKTGWVIGRRVQGTSEMNKTEISEFIDQVITYAADTYHIKINYPNEKIMLDFDKADRETNFSN